MSNIKTWKERLQEDYPDMNLSDLTDCEDRRKFAEISDLCAALAKAEVERDALQAKLMALEGQKPVAYRLTEPDLPGKYHYFDLIELHKDIGLEKLYAAAGVAPAAITLLKEMRSYWSEMPNSCAKLNNIDGKRVCAWIKEVDATLAGAAPTQPMAQARAIEAAHKIGVKP